MDTTCCFLFRVITGRHSFLYKLIVTQKFGVTAMLLRSLKQVFWKKSVFYIHYFHNNIAMLLIPQCSYFLHVLNKIYFFIANFYSFNLWMIDLNVIHFSLWMEFLKIQKLSRVMFLIKNCTQIFMTLTNCFS